MSESNIITMYNLKTISKIKVFRKRKDNKWVWKPKRKFLNIVSC